MNKINNRHIAPEFHRIPHFNKEISNHTHDDIIIEDVIKFPFDCYIQEKIDGANLRISWNNGPVLGNREHLLKKGYTKIKTNAKRQFVPAWNYLHKHEKDIKKISDILMSDITIYGEWMNYKHSIYYDNLPDIFIAYDIWSVQDNRYLSPNRVEELLSLTSIKYIKPSKVTLSSIDDLIEWSEKSSEYTNGLREGVVVKTDDGLFMVDCFKVVNKFFTRSVDFNDSDPIKNVIKNR